MPRRATDWRQGSVLADADAYALGLTGASQTNNVVVVISHDCDLANAEEPEIEVIVGTALPLADQNYRNARNPRRLHAIFSVQGAPGKCVELRHVHRHSVAREKFDALQPSRSLTLAEDEKRMLKQWLAARYGRPAFPDAFEDRLHTKYKKKDVPRHIESIVAPVSKHLLGIFFDLGPERGQELPDDVPYFLGISVVYDAVEGGLAARVSAEQAAAEITKLFHTVFGKPESATLIVLDQCVAIADDQMTLADLRRVDQWRVEHLSFREQPAGEFLSVAAKPV